MPTLPADLLAAYNTAIIDVVLPHGNFVVSAGVSAGEIELPVLLQPLFWVITPCNPRSKKVSARTNTQRFEAFWSEACEQNERDVSCFQAVGRSPDGTWSEDSVAFVGMSELEALTLARNHEQNAVYCVSPSGVHVVVVDVP